MRRPLLVLILILVVTGCAGAAALELRSGSSPVPVLTIASPRSGSTVTSELVTVSGSAPPESRVVRDISYGPDDHVLTGRDGSWSIDVPLHEGANVLTFRVGDDQRSTVAMVLNYATDPSLPPEAADSPPVASTDPAPAASATAAAVTRAPASTPAPQPTLALGMAPVGLTETAVVVRVVDGDTIEVDRGRGPEKVRYIGMDTPETVHPSEPVEWMGAEATAANRRFVEGREVVLEADVSETDQYDRLLRYVWTREGDRWLFVNLALVTKGFAQVSTYPPDVRYADLFLARQATAREQGVGLWATPPPTPAPPTPAPAAVAPQPLAGNCHDSYEGACLTPGIGDYDCSSGNGNGPNYVTGPVRVVGPDEFGLDGNGDGEGCEG